MKYQVNPLERHELRKTMAEAINRECERQILRCLENPARFLTDRAFRLEFFQALTTAHEWTYGESIKRPIKPSLNIDLIKK